MELAGSGHPNVSVPSSSVLTGRAAKPI